MRTTCPRWSASFHSPPPSCGRVTSPAERRCAMDVKPPDCRGKRQWMPLTTAMAQTNTTSQTCSLRQLSFTHPAPALDDRPRDLRLERTLPAGILLRAQLSWLLESRTALGLRLTDQRTARSHRLSAMHRARRAHWAFDCISGGRTRPSPAPATTWS